jgi:glucose-1-phosphate thymidylyltransferase
MKEVCGLLLAGGNGTRLSPLTNVVNKHFLPIYDKPMIYYSISTLMLTGIRDIALISRPQDQKNFHSLFGDGSDLGLNIRYIVQPEPQGIPQAYILAEKFIDSRNVVLTLGDNLFIGQGLGESLKLQKQIKGIKIFAFPVNNPHDYGVVEIDHKTGKVKSIEEKPTEPKSKYAIPGLYFSDSSVIELAKDLKPSNRNELEMVDLIKNYLERDELEVQYFRRGIGWLDTGSVESLYAANDFVALMQKRLGLRFGCPEEIAFRLGWINAQQLQKNINKIGSTDYRRYLETIMSEEITN